MLEFVANVNPRSYTLLPLLRRLCLRRCLFVCLFFCLLVSNFAEKLQNGFACNFQEGLAIDR